MLRTPSPADFPELLFRAPERTVVANYPTPLHATRVSQSDILGALIAQSVITPLPGLWAGEIEGRKTPARQRRSAEWKRYPARLPSFN
ncbi:hypothetical protein J6590_049587 [Homalodisca vitripennis]|nr:hypothetical protein J6590_049587 [Homalodisca vitripennis]